MQTQQLGVAVTTSFMPTHLNAANTGSGAWARDLIQFSSFSGGPEQGLDGAVNYGVAPDFACGHRVFIPAWAPELFAHRLPPVGPARPEFFFLDRKGPPERPGFFLALLRDGDFAALEAFDTWLEHDVSFEQFHADVLRDNAGLLESGLKNRAAATYRTHNGNTLGFTHLE